MGGADPAPLTQPPEAFERVLRGRRRARGRLRESASGGERRRSLPLFFLSSAVQMCSHIWIRRRSAALVLHVVNNPEAPPPDQGRGRRPHAFHPPRLLVAVARQGNSVLPQSERRDHMTAPPPRRRKFTVFNVQDEGLAS